MDKLIIGIAGPSGGGKTTLTNKIKGELSIGDMQMIKYDDYYKSQDDIPFEDRIKTNYDHPDAFDTDLLIEHLMLLKKNKSIQKPIYDFKNHTRKEEVELVEPKNVIIIEGIFTLLDERLRNLLDIKLYVLEDSDICFIRRLIRDTNERGRTQKSVIDQYISTVKPMQEKFVDPTKKYADLIVLRARENEIALKMIINQIKNKI